jgi:ribonucleoside-diphosphate reductase beta chain
MENSQAFNQNNNEHLTSLAFLDPNGGVSIQRYDTMKYKSYDKLTEKQISFFWVPQEVELTNDQNDFKKLSASEKHIFTSNLKRQILLDSVQGRCPSLAFLPIVSLPEIEAFIQTWSFSETIHSRSYSHIIRNIYSDPGIVFDTMMDISEIVDCAKDISFYYDQLIGMAQWYNLLGEGKHKINGKDLVVDLYEIKKALWLTLMSVNVLEGLRFYVSFACAWSFAESKKMEGNAKIIKLICRDENVHLAATQLLLKLLPKDDPDYEKIRIETMDECKLIFTSAATQEKEWAKFLFKDGSIIGLNEKLLIDYVDWLTNKRMQSVGLKFDGDCPTANPLPWTMKWIAGEDVQVAPQETQISSYTTGEVNNDLREDSFKGFSL